MAPHTEPALVGFVDFPTQLNEKESTRRQTDAPLVGRPVPEGGLTDLLAVHAAALVGAVADPVQSSLSLRATPAPVETPELHPRGP